MWGTRCSFRCDTSNNFVWDLKLIFTVILHHGDVAVTLAARIGCDSLCDCWSIILSLPVVRIRNENVCVREVLERFDCAFLLTVNGIKAKVSRFLE